MRINQMNAQYQPCFKAVVNDFVLMNVITDYPYIKTSSGVTEKNKFLAELLNQDFNKYKNISNARKAELTEDTADEIVKKYTWLEPIVSELKNRLEVNNYNLSSEQKKQGVHFFRNRAYREVKCDKVFDITLDDETIEKLNKKYFDNATVSAVTILEILTNKPYSFDPGISKGRINRAMADLSGVRVTDVQNLKKNIIRYKEFKDDVAEEIINIFPDYKTAATEIEKETLILNNMLREDQKIKFRDQFIKTTGSKEISFNFSDEVKQKLQEKYFS